MSLADEVFDLTIEALTYCSEQQRAVYQLVHGITAEGTTEPLRIEQAATHLGLSRSATRWHLAMSEAIIYKHIARHYIIQQRATLDANTYELPGVSTLETSTRHGISIRDRSKQAYTNIKLGEGSEAVMRANRIGPADTRAAAYQRIQQTMTQRGDQ